MKKILVTAAACLLLAAGASAQGLGDLLKSAAQVVYSYSSNKNAVSLPGNWTYTGSAISLGSDNTLSNLAGNAVSAGAESKVDNYLTKFGIKAGALKFTFNEDLTFTCTALGVPVNGTWRTSDDNKTVTLKFGKTLKFLSMTGTLENTLEGCQMLFEGNRFLSFIKTIMTYVGKQNSTVGAVSSLAGNYDKMKIGFKLKKS